jgi:hypothetical protein
MPTYDAASSNQPESPDRLNGWKEIAACFGKGVRTVQRWEHELDLPVHRIDALGGEIVYAFRSELHRWEASRSAGRPNSDTAVTETESGDSPATQDATGSGGVALSTRERRLRWPMVFLSLCIGLLFVGVLVWLFRSSAPAPGQPAKYRIVDRALAVIDEEGQPLWTKRFDFPLTEALYANQRDREDDLSPVAFDDIDDDGNVEVLFVSEPWSDASRGLFCFDNKGKELFRHTPTHVVRFGEKQYGPPWRGGFVAATGATGRRHDIWFVSTHLDEFPTVLEKLDASGKVVGEYWSNGQVRSVDVRVLAGRPLVLVGATNNESRCASLAVLDALRPTGSAPALLDHYRCAGCLPGNPLAFLLLPRLDVALVDDDLADVMRISVDAIGQVWVDVRHFADRVAPELQRAATSIYTLDSDFRVLNAELGQRVGIVHQALEKKNLLDHPFSVARDSRELWPVRRWTGAAFADVLGPESHK